MNINQILEIKNNALNYLSNRRNNDRRQYFSETSQRELIDATSLHIDLAHMLDRLDKHEIFLLNKILDQQSSTDGFFHEQDNDYTSNHPRVREMAGTYLGFQVSELLLKLNISAGEFVFWQFLKDKTILNQYIDNMPWELSPWGAGGWLDALATMIRANIAWGHKSYAPVWDQIIAWVLSNQSKDNGLWGKASVQGIAGQVNGAYHLLRGTLIATNKSIPRAEIMLDTLIDYISTHDIFLNGKGDACHDLDAFYLLWYLKKQLPHYRTNDVKTICLKRLLILKTYQNKDGGFGFYPNESHEIHNYRKTGERKFGDSDIQGTVFYLNSIKAISETAMPEILCPWRFSITHG